MCGTEHPTAAGVYRAGLSLTKSVHLVYRSHDLRPTTSSDMFHQVIVDGSVCTGLSPNYTDFYGSYY
jgi:hypothetical protein